MDELNGNELRPAAWERVRAATVMREALVVLQPDMPLREAIQTLEENDLDGAPVLDAAGKPVGFFSVREIARSEHLTAGQGQIDPDTRFYELPELPGDEAEDGMIDERLFQLKDDYSTTVLGPGDVQDWMSPSVALVRADDPLLVVCRALVESGEQRVLVMDGARMAGTVSAMDLLARLSALPTAPARALL